MEYNKDEYVKSNALVQASINSFTVAQNRLMTALLTKFVNNYDEVNKFEDVISISKYDLMNILYNSKGGEQTALIDKTLDNFAQNSFVKWIDEDEKTNRTPIFINVSNNKLDDDKCMIEFQWNPIIKSQLVGMKDNYVRLVKSNFMALTSKKSQSLYEFLHSYVNLNEGKKNQGEITVEVEKLKELTNCTSSSYNKFTNFYQKGIKETLDEINEKTDIDVVVLSKNKKKTRIISITFKVKNSKAKKAWFDEYPTILLTDDEYRTVTQDFNVGGMPVGKKLVNKLAKTKEKKPNQIHNDFKQLEKYYKAELKKYEKEQNQNLAKAKASDLNFDGLYANTRNDVNEPLPGQETIFDLGVEDIEKKEKEQEEIFEMLKQYD